MSTTEPRRGAGSGSAATTRGEPHPSTLDRELSLSGIVLFGVGLALTMALSAVVVWLVAGGLTSMLAAEDPPPPVLPEARQRWEPPEPRLQTAPEEELEAMRAEERQRLHGWGWVDETAGIARVPIDVAIDLVAEHGLAPEPVATAAAPAAEAAEATAEGSGDGGNGGAGGENGGEDAEGGGA